MQMGVARASRHTHPDYGTLPVSRIDQLARVIHPGACAVEKRRPLSTLLGSCVSVCLFDPQNGVGGLNHFMIPSMCEHSTSLRDPLLSGDKAMAALLDALLTTGADRNALQAKVFGGGSPLKGHGMSTDIGRRNAEFARDWLRGEAIPIVVSDLLGPWSRKVVFLPDSGNAFCKRMALGGPSMPGGR